MNVPTFILKLYLFIFNILLWVGSVALLAGVAYYFYRADQYNGVADDRNVLVYIIIPLVLIFLMIFFIYVLGIIPPCFNVKPIILVYGILLVVVVGLQVAGGVLIVLFRDIVVEQATIGFKENIPSYIDDAVFKEALDAFQSTQMCCGDDGPSDWLDQGITIPQSCCITEPCDTNVTAEVYTEGCVSKLREIYFQPSIIFVSVAILLALIQTSGVVVAFILVCCCRKEEGERLIEMKSKLPKY